jgi:hypothetical protein
MSVEKMVLESRALEYEVQVCQAIRHGGWCQQPTELSKRFHDSSLIFGKGMFGTWAFHSTHLVMVSQDLSRVEDSDSTFSEGRLAKHQSRSLVETEVPSQWKRVNAFICPRDKGGSLQVPVDTFPSHISFLFRWFVSILALTSWKIRKKSLLIQSMKMNGHDTTEPSLRQDDRLQGRVAVIIGSSFGLGRAMPIKFAWRCSCRLC